MPTDTLPVTGDRNVREKDSNTKENMNNGLTSNDYLNDQTISCSQTLRLDAEVDIGEIKVGWDKIMIFQITYNLM